MLRWGQGTEAVEQLGGHFKSSGVGWGGAKWLSMAQHV
jgi:hypothetical protein